MEFKMAKTDWLFLILCLVLGIVAEQSFWRYEIGVSYFVFLAIFYSIFFWRFRKFSFSHQRLGYLILISIWVLAASYYLYDTTLFYSLNLIVIPGLVIFHLALITSPKKMEWHNLAFIGFVFQRLGKGIHFGAQTTGHIPKLLKREQHEKHYNIGKKILIGVLISVPFLFIILNLLISADDRFASMIWNLPNLVRFDAETIFRIVLVLIYTIGFFGFMQVLLQKPIQEMKEKMNQTMVMDGVITLTVLFLLNSVYIVFVAVQFQYFFSDTLAQSFTYAEYARRGFFELLLVTMINLSVITAVIQFTRVIQGTMKLLIRLTLSLLVALSAVLLLSAFDRMMMYEEAYGYTFTRVLVLSFMIFLFVIFAYTLVRIWLERLSLFHFYFIAALIYYVGINIVNLDKIVVEKNIARYEEKEKIDVNYMSYLSATGVLGLIDLYEKDPNVPGLKGVLREQKSNKNYFKRESWQSSNLTREKAYEKLTKLELK
ncbi:DUF4153 domain-containing protein [Cytobacillus purgationiresistens]|uniref:DUF4173 domain-containing protein n=1 Tax=Cytobacillus purgationiresistens TaxID=863449 RepID=A0ABU0AJ58_9BACI|nr:DUF4173 domain-containing protein [Cytobacillus purgationiresistens]MDQ0271277.1 hypothetical protein [Cytobacillus purgationiresistens]